MFIKFATQTILAVATLLVFTPSAQVSACAPSGSVNYFINPDCFLLANWTFNSASDVGISFSPYINGLSYTSGTISSGSLSSSSGSSTAIDFVDVTFSIAQGSIFTLEGIQLGDVNTAEAGSPSWDTYRVSLIDNGSNLKTSGLFIGYTGLSNQYWEFATTAPNNSSTGSITINALSAPQTMTLRFASNAAGNDAINIGDVKLYGKATTTPVPEPSGVVLLGVSLFGVVARRRPRIGAVAFGQA